MSPSISVVITTYNRHDYLSEALASVLKQQHKPMEIIIVNDGSSSEHEEDYKNLIQAYSAENLHYIKLPQNMGANFARNYAVKQASGDIIAFLDNDDTWNPEYLFEHIKVYQNNQHISAVTSGFTIMGTEQRKVNQNTIVSTESLKQGNIYCGMSGISVKRSVLLAFLFDETLSNGQDWDLLVRLVQSNHQIANINKVIFAYRKHAHNSISIALRNMKFADSEQRLASAFKHREWLGEKYFKYRVADQLLGFIHKKPDKLKWIKQSIILAGWRITASVLLRKLMRK